MVRKGLIISIVVALVAVLIAVVVTVVLLMRRKQVFAYRPIPVTGAQGVGKYHTLASGAKAAAEKYGELATYSQMEAAYKKGAQWCDWNWIMDDRAGSPTLNTVIMALPTQTAIPLCGGPTGNVGLSIGPSGPNALADVAVYGRKPRKSPSDGSVIFPWYSEQDGTKVRWSKFRI